MFEKIVAYLIENSIVENIIDGDSEEMIVFHCGDARFRLFKEMKWIDNYDAMQNDYEKKVYRLTTFVEKNDEVTLAIESCTKMLSVIETMFLNEARGKAFEKFSEFLDGLEKEGRIDAFEKVIGRDCMWDLTENNEDFSRDQVDWIFEVPDIFSAALNAARKKALIDYPYIIRISPEDFSDVSMYYVEDVYEYLHSHVDMVLAKESV